jgi:predicted DNA-binding protein (UPF0251 family)
MTLNQDYSAEYRTAVSRKMFHQNRKQGRSKISAVLLITAFIVATALTVLLLQTTSS